jgi:hypothetical protein
MRIYNLGLIPPNPLKKGGKNILKSLGKEEKILKSLGKGKNILKSPLLRGI